jgi:hypothetical protein
MDDTHAEHEATQHADHELAMHQEFDADGTEGGTVAAAGSSRKTVWVGAAALAAAIVAYGAWVALRSEPMLPIAVQRVNGAAAGAAVERGGVRVEWRDGHPWVKVADAGKAAEIASAALAQVRQEHPAAGALADESVFLSTESARARRLVATMSAVEQMIEAQAGVLQARVVLAEAGRPGSPGSAYSGATAAATVTMESGEMSQDLVDAVAAMVSGSVPGLSVDRVAVIDSKSNRQRTPRSASARQAADTRRERERELSELVRSALPGGRDAQVTIRMDDAGTPHAVVMLSYSYGLRVLESSGSAAVEETLLVEEDRVGALAQTLLAHQEGCIPRVTVSVARVPESEAQVASTAEAEHAGGVLSRVDSPHPQGAAGAAVAASVNRERSTPLGPTSGSARAWDAGALILVALAIGAVAAGLAMASRRSRRAAEAAMGHAEAEESEPTAAPQSHGELTASEQFEEAPRTVEYEESAAEASDAVRADPTHAAAVLRSWLETGYDARVAHLVVALDSGAAGALLRALPATHVNHVTLALAELGTPTSHDLGLATDALTQELAMMRESSTLDAPAAYAAKGVA